MILLIVSLCFVGIFAEPPQRKEELPSDPCVPYPCGQFSQCRASNREPSCSCLPGYVGVPPACRPECYTSLECSKDKACRHMKCQDPCPAQCGQNAECRVVNHSPICLCPSGYSGDPFDRCDPVGPQPLQEVEQRNDPCSSQPRGNNSDCRDENGVCLCGRNARCEERNGAGTCICEKDFFGDPYSGCRPECVTNEDCQVTLACNRNKCINPCTQIKCGENAVCDVVNHEPICSCLSGYTGLPSIRCNLIPPPPDYQPSEQPSGPCLQSPCGKC